MPLLPGEPAPMFKAPTPSNPNYILGSVGGRYIALGFLPHEAGSDRDSMLGGLQANRRLFDDDKCVFFGVLRDPALIAEARDEPPGVRWFLDPDHTVSSLYDVGPEGRWVVLDPSMRVLMTGPAAATDVLLARVASLPPIDAHAGVPLHAPVLIAPRVFEPEFCRHLISLYEEAGGTPSGFMRDIEGKTVGVHDPSHKRRSDYSIAEAAIQAAARVRISQRLIPEIAKAFQFTATRIERYLVACYDSTEQGFFRAHRDNTTKGTAHRKFAVTINLNTGEYEGGELRFPEFGSRTYRAPRGGAVVFSCSLLHEATPVTRGRRYAFLPFLYDDAGARIREQNAPFLVGGEGYRAGPVAAEAQA